MKRMVLVVLLALSVAPRVFAQGVGSVRGAVTDEKGATIVGADVAITNTDTAYSRSMSTDTDGNYGFQSLPIGRYVLRVKKGGFKDFEEKDISLHVNDALTLDAQLKVGGATEIVEVTASTAQVELANGELSFDSGIQDPVGRGGDGGRHIRLAPQLASQDEPRVVQQDVPCPSRRAFSS